MAAESSILAWKNPMDGGAWQATVHGVAKSRTRLSDFTFTVSKILHKTEVKNKVYRPLTFLCVKTVLTYIQYKMYLPKYFKSKCGRADAFKL